MTAVKPNWAYLPVRAGVIGAARELFLNLKAKPRAPVVHDTMGTPVPKDVYACLLDVELGRQTMTAAERDDADTLDRVRAALYSD